ncbi:MULTISPECIES: hypothetical protein [Inquilinus]|uniref:Uncharacterized protein n=1 Tax=Inquilinus ginsengisoli TaxID=363840 RepID=A0ABU1JL12_9PROT|nr:hypothetical protein [Inquilinus ginsengisoli]MDR6289017.1 hypothetical protein [Inquilinus ginsengisoli]
MPLGSRDQAIVETGLTWPQVLKTAVKWAGGTFGGQSAIVLAELIREAGSRGDLPILDAFAGRSEAADQAIADASFVVRRRAFA